MAYKLIIFDMDLTLIDTVRSSIQCYEKAFKLANKDFDANKVMDYMAEALIITYNNFINPSCTKDEFFAIFDKTSAKTLEKYTDFYPDSLPFLKKLISKNYKLAIVTNRPLADVKIMLAKDENAFKMFSFIATSDNISKLKPNPHPILKVLEELKIKNNEAIYLGDAYNDYLAASRANVDFICLNRHNQVNFKCEKMVKSFDELEF